MKKSATWLLVPAILLATGCASHHGGHHRGHHGHYPPVSGHVSVHTGYYGHGNGGAVLGALIVGGIIGHVITEAAHEHEAEHEAEAAKKSRRSKPSTAQTPDGSNKKESEASATTGPKVEKNSEQNKYYQLGKDDNCYLMEKKGEQVIIIAKVPRYPCSE
ncbi:hypothetical protein SG34_018385 [Thalassomonas viridans]|uniref:Lipoprotein n=1 Tax=Thalassomonas viridans TaxID=137584 RepID=A0AAF0C7Z7_9GAMM|nr:hypothetical protein [Thalassomonas viridans]WDE03359.1 hypothetical protein SG34_018385 [Thalassomonas viridans]